MKCKICKKRFKLMKENRYLAAEKVAAFGTLTKLPKVFEAFDCPHCGCQNIVNTREEAVGRNRGEEDDSILLTFTLIGTTEFVIGLLLLREYDKIRCEARVNKD